MVTKIIQQQRERQSIILKGCNCHLRGSKIICPRIKSQHTIYCVICDESMRLHKQFLIELKEHFEEKLKDLKSIVQFFPPVWIVQLERDITELNKLIGRYE